MAAVEATQTATLAADDGQLIDTGDDGELLADDDGDDNPEACENGQVGCCGPDSEDLPCFACYQAVSAEVSR